jgi:small subunit ribosomal protein S2
MAEDGTHGVLTKKEVLRMERMRLKLERNLGGIKDMPKLPGAIFVVDPAKEHIAVAEAHRLRIPVVAVADTNADPNFINYVIPGNDDALRAIRLFTSKIADAVLEGRQIATEGEFQQVSAEGVEGEYAIMTEDGMIVTEKGVVNPDSAAADPHQHGVY